MSAEHDRDAPGIEVDRVSKRFGGLAAVREVSLRIDGAGLTGIVGPNGAGKTTLLNIITGALNADQGSVRLNGRAVTGRPSEKIVRAGLTRTFQEMRLFDSLAVSDNVGLALHFGARRSRGGSMRTELMELLAEFGLSEYRRMPAKDLAYGIQKRVALARAVATGAFFLALDEPLAGLSPSEVEEFAVLLRTLSATRGLIVVEHNLPTLTSIASHLVVLYEGAVLASGEPQAVMAQADVRAAYLGEVAA